VLLCGSRLKKKVGAVYERPFFKFVYARGKLRRGKVIFPDDDEYMHAKLIPKPYRSPTDLDEMVAGWVAIKSDRVIATSWPPWDEMERDSRQAVQQALQVWCDSQGLPLTLALPRRGAPIALSE
jgi:hypothetical protein